MSHPDFDGHAEAGRPPPDDAVALYHEIRARMRQRVVGHSEAVTRLALMGAQHLLGAARQRALLVGPSGCGKSTLTRALAEALEVPHVIVDVTGLAEQNWRGYDLSDVARDLYERSDDSLARMHKAVVVLDEIDKVGLGQAEGAGKDYRLGKQQSLLSLLGGGLEIRFGLGGDDRSLSWMTDQALLVGAGVFDGLPTSGPVSPGELIEWGFIPELVERLGSVVRLSPLEGKELIQVLRSDLDEVAKMFDAFGYRLEFTDEAVSYVARAVERSGGSAGPRSGVSWLRAAGERGLVRLLHAKAQEGSTWMVTPDDVRIPPSISSGSPPRGLR